MFSPEFMDYTLPYIIIGLFIVIIIYFLSVREELRLNSLEIGRKLGFTPYSGERGYILQANLQGLQVLLNIVQDIGGRGHPPYFEVDVRCRVPNTSCKSLCAYPESALGLNRPVGLLPAEVSDVGGWDWCTVRGEPAELIARVLPKARKDGGVFQESHGFRLLELDNSALVSHFSLNGHPRPEQVGEMVKGAVALAAALNAA